MNQTRTNRPIGTDDGTTSHVERLSDEEMGQLGITQDMLQAAIEAFGGAINISGHYPISDEIGAKLAEAEAEKEA